MLAPKYEGRLLVKAESSGRRHCWTRSSSLQAHQLLFGDKAIANLVSFSMTPNTDPAGRLILEDSRGFCSSRSTKNAAQCGGAPAQYMPYTNMAQRTANYQWPPVTSKPFRKHSLAAGPIALTARQSRVRYKDHNFKSIAWGLYHVANTLPDSNPTIRSNNTYTTTTAYR